MNAAPHHKVLIVGGGTAGITVAARLARKISGSDIGLIEPSDKHSPSTKAKNGTACIC